MIYLILFESENLAGSGFSRQDFIATAFFLLLASIIIGLGAVVGYKAFRSKDKK
jgi:hypothetical protein